MSTLVDKTLGKYHILTRLGRGGMADVYQAYQPRLDRYVAVKVLHSQLAEDADFVDRFEREPAMVARLRHPNIVQVYDFDVEGEQYYMVMELVGGPTLKAELEARSLAGQPFSLAETVHLFTALGSAIDYAHARDMVHHDLKPGNIMFTADGQVVLTDFGLARIVGAGQHTATGAVYGTPGYISPEQAQGERGDGRSDIYALGLILYELVAGRRPFEADTPFALLMQHIKEPVPPPRSLNSDLPEAVEAVILKTLSKDPNERFQRAADLARALRAAVGLTAEEPLAATTLNTIAPPPQIEEVAVTPTPERSTPTTPPPCPYRGLYTFREEDAPFFFGRETFTEQLLAAVHRQALVAVVGPSGSGKSSVVFAGLVAQLRPGLSSGAEGQGSRGAGVQGSVTSFTGAGGQGSSSGESQKTQPEIENPGWRIASFRPGNRPFQTLAAALIPLLEPEMSETERLVETRKLAEVLSQGDVPLYEVVDRIVQKDYHRSGQAAGADRPGSGVLVAAPQAGLDQSNSLEDGNQTRRLLLVADQFEELYTLCSEPGIRHRFLDALLEVVDIQQFRASPTFTLVLTLRVDFLGQALTHRPLADFLQDADVMLGPMSRPELERAITIPARRQGVKFESGLMTRILDDVSDEPGNLPLLEFALTTLWDRIAKGRLSHQAYEEIGRVAGALARYADEVYRGLSPAEQKNTRRIFIQMVRPGEGTEDTRRLATRAELDEADWELVRKLADARLVVTGQNPLGQETVEVVHEALLRGWRRLRAWMAADRAFRVWQERLRAALRQWEASDQDEGALLRGVPLVEAEGRLAERAAYLSQAEQEFIQAGVALRERQEAEREQERADRERLRRRITQGLAAGLVIAVVLLVIAGWQWQRAAQERQVAEEQRQAALQAQAIAAIERDQAQVNLSRQLAALALTRLDDQLDLALLLSLEANRIAATFEARSSLRTALAARPQLKTFLRGHRENVNSVVFSPDGQTLASAGNDGTIRLWAVATGQPLGLPLTGHRDGVRSLAFSPDGQTLASGSDDRSIVLWNVASGQPLGPPLTGHRVGLGSVTFSPDGQILASSSDETIILWDMATDQPLGSPLTGHADWVRSVAFSPDGQTLASGSWDSSIILWDVATGQPMGSPLTGHKGAVWSITFSPDGQTLASGSEDKTVILWDVTAGQPLRSPLTGHSGRVNSVVFSSDGQTLASTSNDSSLILWDVASGRPLDQPFTDHTGSVLSAAFSPDGRLLASSSATGQIILWNVADRGLDATALGPPLTGHTARVSGLAFSPDGRTLASGGDDKSIILWDMATGQRLGPPLTGHTPWVRGVEFSPDGRLLASIGGDSTVMLWDMTTRPPLGSSLTGSTYPNPITFLRFRRDVAFSPDGQILASTFGGSRVMLWDVTTRQALGSPLAGHTDFVYGVAFSPDGKTLVSSSVDGTIILWDVAGGQPLGPPLTDHFGPVNTVAFSPDGQTLASSSEDESIILWDVARGHRLGPPLSGHNAFVWSVAFSPDGQTLASAGEDRTIILWDAASGRPLGPRLTGHTAPVKIVAFSPDGQTLASGSDDHTIILWDVGAESGRARACRRANRNLTRAEWQQFFGDQPYQATCPDLPVPGE